jgi:lipoprotein-anchoring transpeptidase ErfK/SrfK
MPSFINRRQFLKLGAAALAWALSRKVPVLASSFELDSLPDFLPPPASLGRIINARQPILRAPLLNAELVEWKVRDEVIPLKASLLGEAPWPSNPVWYFTEGGFIHSAYVHPSENLLQTNIVTSVSAPGFWAEVTVPVAISRSRPNSLYAGRRLYYETTYRVVNAVQDEQGEWWYQLQEGLTWSPGPYAPAAMLRPITREDLAPISFGHPDKWIQIDISDQMLTCFEGQTPVFSTPVASGVSNAATPLGEFRILYKRHAQRMIGADYDLVGVAFPSYITNSGVAIHGTYWHNDYGRRHSHGCLNVSSRAARWVFRWVEPQVPYELYTYRSTPEEGTRVVVIA